MEAKLVNIMKRILPQSLFRYFSIFTNHSGRLPQDKGLILSDGLFQVEAGL